MGKTNKLRLSFSSVREEFIVARTLGTSAVLWIQRCQSVRSRDCCEDRKEVEQAQVEGSRTSTDSARGKGETEACTGGGAASVEEE